MGKLKKFDKMNYSELYRIVGVLYGKLPAGRGEPESSVGHRCYWQWSWLRLAQRAPFANSPRHGKSCFRGAEPEYKKLKEYLPPDHVDIIKMSHLNEEIFVVKFF